MSFKDCKAKLLKELEGTENVRSELLKVTKKMTDDVELEKERLLNMYKRENTGESLEVLTERAEKDALNSVIMEKKNQIYSKVKTAQANIRLETEMKSHQDGLSAGLASHIFTNPNARAGYQSAEELADGHFSNLTRNLASWIEENRSKIPGGLDSFLKSRKVKQYQLIKALKGEQVSDPLVAQIAKQIDDTFDRSFSMLNAAGVPARRLKNRGMGQYFDSIRVDKVGLTEFKSDILDRLDTEQMLKSNGTRMSTEEIDEMIDEVYKNIVTGGISKNIKAVKVAGNSGVSDLISKHSMSRVLHFKTAKDQIDLHNKYGSGDIFDGILNEIKSFSTDIAIAQKFGPTPNSTFNRLNQLALEDKALNKTKRGTLIDNQTAFDYLMGRQNKVTNPKVAGAFATLRNTSTAIRLDKAVISALADVAYSRQEAKLLGMSATKVYGKTLKHIMSFNKKERRELATRMGMSVDWAHGIASAASKYTQVDSFGKISQGSAMMADFTVRASGLAAWTRIGRQSFHMELQSHISGLAKNGFDELPDGIKRMFDSRGITSAEWDSIRKASSKIDGHDFIDPDKMSDTLAAKYLGMIDNHTSLAVPEPGLETRAFISGTQPRGDIGRELRQSVFQFQAFPVTVLINNIRKMNRVRGSKARFLADTVLATTMIASLSVQLKEIADGREPFNVDSPELWTRASMLGALGNPVADAAVSQIQQGQTASQVAARFAGGPGIGLLAEFIVGGGKMIRDVTGANKKAKTPGVLIDFFEEASLGTDQWYFNYAADRFLWNRSRELFDPDYRNKRKRSRRRMRREQDRGMLFDN